MSQEYSISEIAQNNGRDGKPVWIIFKDGVYDVTKFLNDHPGGEASLLEYAGKDATKAFNEVGHSTDAVKEMKSYKIGVLRTENAQIINSQPAPASSDLSAKQPSENYSTPKKKPAKFCFCC
ncbi:PREDICTED: cytochrome b5 [Rhagoletis zephyria]|uniref:cytochrome b5 n=1 Tax=Rhagoletis zephyria TaxID=28612 RepID=UPI0008118483|nr:PREDICTED: cytochrome b5 [Rhagoletis zephyria]